MSYFRKLPLALSLPAVLVLGATAFVAGPARQGQAPPSPVAVVDMERVLTTYSGAKQKEDEWKEMEAGFRQQMDALREEAEVALGLVQGFDEGTEERARANLVYEMKRHQYEGTGKIIEVKANQRRLDISIELYEEIRRGIGKFAKAKGYKLVLRLRTDRPGQNRELRAERNQQREVLFHDAAVDVTDGVIRFLKQWKPDDAR